MWRFSDPKSSVIPFDNHLYWAQEFCGFHLELSVIKPLVYCT